MMEPETKKSQMRSDVSPWRVSCYFQEESSVSYYAMRCVKMEGKWSFSLCHRELPSPSRAQKSLKSLLFDNALRVYCSILKPWTGLP